MRVSLASFDVCASLGTFFEHRCVHDCLKVFSLGELSELFKFTPSHVLNDGVACVGLGSTHRVIICRLLLATQSILVWWPTCRLAAMAMRNTAASGVHVCNVRVVDLAIVVVGTSVVQLPYVGVKSHNTQHSFRPGLSWLVEGVAHGTCDVQTGRHVPC